MGKKPKGFGKPATPPPTKTQSVPKVRSLKLNPLPDHEFLWQKEGRLRQIWGEAEIPTVSVASLSQYRQYLLSQLSPDIAVRIAEPLSWETPYLFGTGSLAEYQTRVQEQPSHLNRYQYLSLSADVTLSEGLSVVVQRRLDLRQFTLPLHLFRPDAADEPGGLSSLYLSDYRLWWEDYQPFFREG